MTTNPTRPLATSAGNAQPQKLTLRDAEDFCWGAAAAFFIAALLV